MIWFSSNGVTGWKRKIREGIGRIGSLAFEPSARERPGATIKMSGKLAYQVYGIVSELPSTILA
jgi:hypothetical protein